MKIIIVGIDNWEKYTKPCIDSILEHEPKAEIVVIDNGSKRPYPQYKNVCIHRLIRTVCYAGAMNEAITLFPREDWYFFINNDVLFHKPFQVHFSMFDYDTLYGFYMHKVEDREYLSSWAMILPGEAVQEIGYFDERFAPMGYEDADYCWRAMDKGYKIMALMRNLFGIEHLDRGDRQGFPQPLLDYLKEKHNV